MSRAFQRFKGAFKRKRRVQESPDDTNQPADRERPLDRIRTPPVSVEDNANSIEDDIASSRGSNRSQRAEQIRRPTPLRERSPSITSNQSQTNLRPVPNIARSTAPLSNPPIPTNITPVSNVQDRNALPIPPPPLHTNSNQPPIRPLYAHLLTRNRRPFRPTPNSTLIGFPSHQISRWQRPLRTSFPAQKNPPTLEFDYPIENVFADEHIPPSVAIKINEAIDYDRFGQAHHTHHYAYEPTTQDIQIGNNQHIQRRLMNKSSHQGLRYIREIPEENSYSVQFSPVSYQICPPCDFNLISPTVQYFSAYATPNDPMRLW